MSKSTHLSYPTLKQILRNPRLFLAFGLGSGLSRVMPGTVGTLFAIPIYVLIAELTLFYYLAIVALSIVLGVYLCGHAARELRVHDHPGIVWDEFAGFWITMIAVPLSWQSVLVGCFLFRFFDIIKPWPIKAIDRSVHGGLGIMLDDVLAGLASLLCMQALLLIGLL